MSATGNAARPLAAAGFTLVEVLVVLGITGLITGLGFPQLRNQMTTQEWRSSVSGTMALLRSARATAIRGDRPAVVSLAPGGRVLRLDGRDTVTLPASVRVALPGPIRFAGDGSSNGGSVAVTGRRQTMRINVAPATGLLLARAA